MIRNYTRRNTGLALDTNVRNTAKWGKLMICGFVSQSPMILLDCSIIIWSWRPFSAQVTNPRISSRGPMTTANKVRELRNVVQNIYYTLCKWRDTNKILHRYITIITEYESNLHVLRPYAVFYLGKVFSDYILHIITEPTNVSMSPPQIK